MPLEKCLFKMVIIGFFSFFFFSKFCKPCSSFLPVLVIYYCMILTPQPQKRFPLTRQPIKNASQKLNFEIKRHGVKAS